MKKIIVKLRTPVPYFKYSERGNSFEIRNDEEVEVFLTIGIMKLLTNRTLILVTE